MTEIQKYYACALAPMAFIIVLMILFDFSAVLALAGCVLWLVLFVVYHLITGCDDDEDDILEY